MAEKKSDNMLTKNSCEYQLNELVFVEMTGFSYWWPSRIIFINPCTHRFIVSFLGNGRWFVFDFIFACQRSQNSWIHLLFNSSLQIPKSFLKKLGCVEINEVAEEMKHHALFMVAWRECQLLIEFMQHKVTVSRRPNVRTAAISKTEQNSPVRHKRSQSERRPITKAAIISVTERNSAVRHKRNQSATAADIRKNRPHNTTPTHDAPETEKQQHQFQKWK